MSPKLLLFRRWKVCLNRSLLPRVEQLDFPALPVYIHLGIYPKLYFLIICINFQDSTQLVRIWQRDDGNVIFTGAVKVSRQENHQLDNTTLVISDAQPHDAGGYTCRVMIRARDELSVTHRLIVNTQSFHISTVSFPWMFSFKFTFFKIWFPALGPTRGAVGFGGRTRCCFKMRFARWRCTREYRWEYSLEPRRQL